MKRFLKLMWRTTLKKYYTTRLHKKYSYSQTGEDLIVDFVFKHILQKKDFTYFDVGAHHPFYLSNTALFYKSGMKGVCIEPDPLLHEEISKARSRDVCLNIGVGFTIDETATEDLDFYIMSARTLNTFSREEAERLDSEGLYKILEQKKIPVVHLHRLFKEYFVPDFLSIDVEGIDFEILKSIDFQKYRPKVVCIETAEFSAVPPGKKEEESIVYLKEKDYLVYADTFNNTIFIDNIYLQKLYKNQ
jgi:FkbM family methyltransferase